MPASLETKLAEAVRTRLDGEVDLETLPNGHVCGHIVSRQFQGLDYEQRRGKIRDALQSARTDGELTDQEMLQVSTLLTYTPEEWSVASTDSLD